MSPEIWYSTERFLEPSDLSLKRSASLKQQFKYLFFHKYPFDGYSMSSKYLTVCFWVIRSRIYVNIFLKHSHQIRFNEVLMLKVVGQVKGLGMKSGPTRCQKIRIFAY